MLVSVCMFMLETLVVVALMLSYLSLQRKPELAVSRSFAA